MPRKKLNKRLKRTIKREKNTQVCLAKARYNDRWEADYAIKENSLGRNKPKHYAYECEICLGWHLATLDMYK